MSWQAVEKTHGGVAPSPEPLPDARRKPGRPAQWSGCQVCGVDVSSCRSFHRRYHICAQHMAADSVLLGEYPQRFCQQCGRFHDLDRFAPGMHSCREQLARHAERRRRMRALAAEEARKAGGQRRSASALLGAIPAGVCSVAPAAALTSKRPHSALSELMAVASASQPAYPGHSPECLEAPPRLQGGLSGSSASVHSTHIASGADMEQAAKRGPAGASPCSSCKGMDALLAAAAEEEAVAEAAAAKRPRPPASMHSNASMRAQPLQRSAALSLEPDVTWFAAPAAPAAALAATSQQPTSSGHPPPLRQPSGQPSAVLPMPAHILSALTPEASAVLPPTAQAQPAAPLLPSPQWPGGLSAPGSPTGQPGAVRAAPTLASLLHHLLAAQAKRGPQGLPPAGLAQLAPAFPGATLAQVSAALHVAAARQAQQAQWAAQVQQLLLAAREHEQLQQEQRVAGLFRAAVEGLMPTVLVLHRQPAL